MNTSKATLRSSRNAKFSWPDTKSMEQQFNISSSIIYYITKHPSTPKSYLRLAQSCKYFFEKQPLLIVERISENGTKFCESDHLQGCYFRINRSCCVKIEISKITSKIWLTENLYESKTISSPLYSKLYRCENAQLILVNCNMTFDEFKILALKFQKFVIDGGKITDKNGNIFLLEKIIEVIPNVKQFNYMLKNRFSAIISSSLKNIMKLKNLSNLRKFELFEIPEILDVSDLKAFIEAYKGKKIWFDFRQDISQGYKDKLDDLIDAVFASEILNCIIHYPGQNYEKYMIMKNRYYPFIL